MKRLVFVTALVFLAGSWGVLYGLRGNLYQMVEVYLCEDGIVMAEIAAKVKVSRKQLLTVSYCTCEGLSMGEEIGMTEMKCDPQKNSIYSCSCIGRNHY